MNTLRLIQNISRNVLLSWYVCTTFVVHYNLLYTTIVVYNKL